MQLAITARDSAGTGGGEWGRIDGAVVGRRDVLLDLSAAVEDVLLQRRELLASGIGDLPHDARARAFGGGDGEHRARLLPPGDQPLAEDLAAPAMGDVRACACRLVGR